MATKKIDHYFAFSAITALVLLLVFGFSGICKGQVSGSSNEGQESRSTEISLISKIDLIAVGQGIRAEAPWFYTIEFEYLPKGNQVVSFDLGLGLQGANNRFFKRSSPGQPQSPEEAISSMAAFQAESGIRLYPLNYFLSAPKRGQLVYLRTGIGFNTVQLTEEFFIPSIPEETYTDRNLYGFIQPGIQYQLGGRFHIEGAVIVRLGRKFHSTFPSSLLYQQVHPKLNLGIAF